MKKNFAKNLQRLRNQNDLTQARLAEALNEKYKDFNIQLQRTSIVNYEKEEAMPRIDALYCIADYFGRTIDQIISPTMHKPVISTPFEGNSVSGPRYVTMNIAAREEGSQGAGIAAGELDLDRILTACVDGIQYRQFYIEFLKRLFQTLRDEAPSTTEREKFEKTFYKTFVGCQISRSKYLQDMAQQLLNEQEFVIFMAFEENSMTVENVAKAQGITELEVIDIFNKAQYKLSAFMDGKPKS